MLYLALDAGIGYGEFWAMSPRAVVLVLRQRRRSWTSSRRDDEPVRLNYIPRP